MKDAFLILFIMIGVTLCVGVAGYSHYRRQELAKSEPVQKTPEEIELERKRQQKETDDMITIIIITTIPVVVQ